MPDSVFNSLLIHSVSIYRRVLGSVDSYNIPSETITLITASESCRIDPLREIISIDVRGKSEQIKLVAFFKPTANIKEFDIIEQNSISYEAIAIEYLYNDKELHHLEVLLRNLENRV